MFSRRVTSSKPHSSYPSFQLRVRNRFSISHYSKVPAPLVEFAHVDDVEYLSDYREGGYHPVCIGDWFNDRFRVVHKLGYGTFSTVWLAIDEKTSKYIALKVGTADANHAEVDILSQLTRNTASCSKLKDKPSLIPVVLDRFNVHGPNGSHMCLATLPAMCSVRDAKDASSNALLQLETARSLAGQLAKALFLVHSQGYAHGDLHLGNLLLRLPSSLDSLSIEQLYTRYGEPDREPVVRIDTQAASTDPGVPPYAVPPVWLGKESHKIALDEANLILSDFGVAFRPSEETRFESYTPLVLRPPEAFFEPTKPLTFASDIWSLGCVIFELLAHRSLIDGFLAPEDEITAQQVELQGMMPSEWLARWEKRSKWYDEAGKPLSNESDIWSWDRRFEYWMQNPRRARGLGTLSDEEHAALLKLLRSMLAWGPGDRPSIEKVLESEWMTNWALPAYRKSLFEQ